jgi:hypothetical protein
MLYDGGGIFLAATNTPRWKASEKDLLYAGTFPSVIEEFSMRELLWCSTLCAGRDMTSHVACVKGQGVFTRKQAEEKNL